MTSTRRVCMTHHSYRSSLRKLRSDLHPVGVSDGDPCITRGLLNSHYNVVSIRRFLVGLRSPYVLFVRDVINH
jgi:hypothetical protein